MRNFFRSTAFKILLAAVVVLLACVIAAAAFSGGTSVLTSAVSTVLSPLERACTYIADKVGDAAGGFVSAGAYRDRVEELESQIAEYQGMLVDYEELQRRVESYENFLGVKEENPDFQFVAGTLIGRDAADVFGSFTLSCGETDGVSVGDPVISGEYLIGIVSEVAPTTCVVLSICDPKVSAAAYEIRTGETGYTETTSALAAEGLVKLTGLSQSTTVAPGGIVCTSGVGGVFPRNLIIGTVTQVYQEEGDVSYCAEIRPGVDIGEVQDAFVITDFEGKGDA